MKGISQPSSSLPQFSALVHTNKNKRALAKALRMSADVSGIAADVSGGRARRPDDIARGSERFGMMHDDEADRHEVELTADDDDVLAPAKDLLSLLDENKRKPP